jgi:hypothetical protein
MASLLINLTFLVFFVYMVESPKLTLFALQLDQAAPYPCLLVTNRAVNLPAKTFSFREVALDTWRIKVSCHGEHASGHAVKLSIWTGGVAQVVENLPSEHKALSSTRIK